MSCNQRCQLAGSPLPVAQETHTAAPLALREKGRLIDRYPYHDLVRVMEEGLEQLFQRYFGHIHLGQHGDAAHHFAVLTPPLYRLLYDLC